MMLFMALKSLMPNTLNLSTFEINQMMGVGRWNKQPTMDYDSMVILSTCISNNNVIFLI